MIIKETKFIESNVDYKKCPKGDFPEYAFIGRSNVGKSSLINMLVNQKIAKISNKPGKTKAINHFMINNKWYLVDLPGYGFAKASKKMKSDWTKNIKDYILYREQLTLLFMLIDSRHEPLSNDTAFINWLGENGVPFSIIFTKIDKISQTKLKSNIELYKKKLLENWEELPKMFVTSSQKNKGHEELLEFIEETNKQIK